jgi:hypothetical protein
MSYTKPKIYNLTFSALLQVREVVEIETDTSNDVRVLNLFYDTALESTLKDLDLDSLSAPITLELLAELDDGGPWKYVYKYPNNCAFFRRIVSGAVTDTKRTHISKRIGMYLGGATPQKAIFTNEYEAVAECIPNDLPLAALSVMGGMALVYRLASLASPLITGKGAQKLKDSLRADYLDAKIEAQEEDRLENFNYEDDRVRSEFLDARME